MFYQVIVSALCRSPSFLGMQCSDCTTGKAPTAATAASHTVDPLAQGYHERTVAAIHSVHSTDTEPRKCNPVTRSVSYLGSPGRGVPGAERVCEHVVGHLEVQVAHEDGELGDVSLLVPAWLRGEGRQGCVTARGYLDESESKSGASYSRLCRMESRNYGEV